MKKRICAGILLLFLAGCVGAGAAERTGAVQIAYLPITHSTALMMMQAYAEADAPYAIELVRFTTWPDVVDALRTGRVDGASVLFEVALQAKNEDDSLRLASLSHRGGNVIVVANHIEGYHDLVGQIVAIPHRLSPQHTLLQMVLAREGIAPEDIRMVEISPAEMPFSMASGAIAAYIVAEPFGAVAEAAGVGRVLETSDEISPCAICCVLVFREEALSPSQHQWLLAQFDVAAARAHTRDAAVIETFMTHARLDAAVVERALQHTRFEDLRLTEAEYRAVTEAILAYGILAQVPDFADFILNLE